MTPVIGRRVLYLLFGSVVPVRRAREFDPQPDLYAWNSFVGKLQRSSIDAGPGSRARRLSNLQSGFTLTLVYWNRLCMRKARPMSPAMRSLPVMNAIWPFSLPLSMSR
jgi:hypothetical protein